MNSRKTSQGGDGEQLQPTKKNRVDEKKEHKKNNDATQYLQSP